MKNIGYKKGIVFGIIILFIGVGIHPVLSQETINTAISEIEEDCGCNPIDDGKHEEIKGELNKVDKLFKPCKDCY
ncbi:MAG: hypothetical protein KAR55_03365 [Thermoplasmatales archaeon]|nr:hypothetical protein [Thermoplasmatales archaeon]